MLHSTTFQIILCVLMAKKPTAWGLLQQGAIPVGETEPVAVLKAHMSHPEAVTPRVLARWNPLLKIKMQEINAFCQPGCMQNILDVRTNPSSPPLEARYPGELCLSHRAGTEASLAAGSLCLR